LRLRDRARSGPSSAVVHGRLIARWHAERSDRRPVGHARDSLPDDLAVHEALRLVDATRLIRLAERADRRVTIGIREAAPVGADRASAPDRTRGADPFLHGVGVGRIHTTIRGVTETSRTVAVVRTRLTIGARATGHHAGGVAAVRSLRRRRARGAE